MEVNKVYNSDCFEIINNLELEKNNQEKLF